jgi:hypothetical protein
MSAKCERTFFTAPVLTAPALTETLRTGRSVTAAFVY